MSTRTLHARLDALSIAERPDALEIATLTRWDIPALAALHVVAYDEAPSAENLFAAADEIRMCFDGGLGPIRDDGVIGAWLDGTLVGAVFCVDEGPWDDAPSGPCVLDLMVDPSYRRQGIGTALVNELAQRAGGWGTSGLCLRVDNRHAAAKRLYEVLGFTDVTNE